MKTFEELGLSREFVKTLERIGITTPLEIQEKAIPLVLAGKDVIGGSATGSGKTLVFASSIIENLKKDEGVQALILTPTRELAEQVSITISEFSRHKNLNVLPIYGGVAIQNQIRLLRNADVVVGTPGRILDHLGRRTLDLSQIKFLVLDEVDRMFDMGFQFDVEKILEQCPEKRQTMLFSATISADIDNLSKKYTKNAEEVTAESHVDPTKLIQVYYDTPDNLKFSLLVYLLKKEKAKLVMVFCGTRRNVDFITKNLNNFGIYSKAIHGGLKQGQRNRVMEEFNSEQGTTILVCTDIAARGLDIPGVSHVYNYDLPKTSTDYIHRIGRTARTGKEGIAISILCSRDYENFNNISRDDKLEINPIKIPIIKKVAVVLDKRSVRRNVGRNNFNKGRRIPSRSNRGFSGRSSSSRDRRPSQLRNNRGFRGRTNNSRDNRRPSNGRSSNRNFNRGRTNNSRDNRRPSRGRNNQRRNNSRRY